MQDGSSGGDRKTEWAEYRTDWAEDRTLQANERTFAGWIRTGLGAVAGAIGLKAVFGNFQPLWAAKAVASAFILIAVGLFIAAARGAAHTKARLNTHTARPLRVRSFYIVAAALSLGALGTGAILWMLWPSGCFRAVDGGGCRP